MFNQQLENIYNNGIENYFYEDYKFNNENIIKETAYYSFDLENFNRNDEESIVYSTMLMNIENDICYHNSSVSDLVDNLINLPNITNILYAHNGGKFDYKNILGEFIKRGFTIKKQTVVEDLFSDYKKVERTFLKNDETNIINLLIKDNIIYKAEINCVGIKEYYKRSGKGYKKGDLKKSIPKKIILLDSCLLLQGSLKKICEDYLKLELSKDGLDYEKERTEGYKLNLEEMKYCYEDVFGLKCLLKEVILKEQIYEDDKGNIIFKGKLADNLTSASFSLKVFKKFLYYDTITTDNYKKNWSSKKAIELINKYKTSTNKYNANDIFKEIFPPLSINTDMLVRPTYFGGLCDNGEILHKYNRKGEYKVRQQFNGCVLDENSMYPDKMRNCYLPFGSGKYISEEDFVNYYSEPNVNISFFGDFIARGTIRLKKGKFPTIRLHNINNPGFRKSDIFHSNNLNNVDVRIVLNLNNIDYFNFIDSYSINRIIPKRVIIFNNNRGFFDTFIDYFYNIKSISKGAKKSNAKLILNSIYGKFGTKKLTELKENVYNEELNIIESKNVYNGIKSEEVLSDGIYVPLASIVTGLARNDLKDVAEKVGVKYVNYFDTDSLHFSCSRDYVKSKFKKIDDNNLGYWKIENDIKGGVYLGAKRYAEQYLNDEWDIKCCGIPEADKNFFKYNIDCFAIVENKKALEKGLKDGTIIIKEYKENNIKYKYFYDTINKCKVKGMCLTRKSKAVKNGVIIKNVPYMLT